MITWYQIIPLHPLFLKGGAAVQSSWRRPSGRDQTMALDGKLLHSGFARHYVYALCQKRREDIL